MVSKEILKNLDNLHSKIVRSSFAKNVTESEITALIECKELMNPKKPEHFYKKYGKHTWRKDKSGEIDDFAWEADYHNGVICEVCGQTVCVHCNPDYDELEDCEEEYYICPNCGEKYYSIPKICGKCGQFLDRSDKN